VIHESLQRICIYARGDGGGRDYVYIRFSKESFLASRQPKLRNSGLEYIKKVFPMHKHCRINTDEESNDDPMIF